MPALLNNLLQFFFPRTCAACEKDVSAESEDALCQDCWNSLPRWEGLVCRVCGLPMPDGGARCYICHQRRRRFFICRSAGLYDGCLKQSLLRLKYGGKDYLARTLGKFLAERWREFPELSNVEAVIPVPLHFWRERKRGYNQSELLGEEFCRRTGLPLLRRVLARKRSTRTQTDLSRENRFENVEGAFRVRKNDEFKGRIVMLVDDVCTTGATLEACAAALRSEGAKRVLAFTVARQI